MSMRFDDLTGRFVGGRWRHRNNAAIKRKMGRAVCQRLRELLKASERINRSASWYSKRALPRQTVGTEMLSVLLVQGSRLCTQSCKAGPWSHALPGANSVGFPDLVRAKMSFISIMASS